MTDYPPWAWAAFLVFIALMLALDLGVFHRSTHTVNMREALVWCAVWVALAMGFNTLVYFTHGAETALQFFAGYVVELSLSVDNVFVFILIFTYFQVPAAYHHRVLFWGILGAVVMRAVFIGMGLTLLHHFEWVIFVFGVFLVFSGIRMALPNKKGITPEKNPAVRLFRRLVPVSGDYDGPRFVTRVDGRRMATPLFIVLLVVETTDMVFAVDSIPAILAITDNAFIVFTSNIFAILGLRSFYFALSGVMRLFRFLNIGLAIVLSFVGVKMLLSKWYPIPIEVSLGVIASVLASSILVSVLLRERPAAK